MLVRAVQRASGEHMVCPVLVQFLEYYGLPQHGLTKWEYLGIELLFFVMFFVLAWYLLAFKQHSKR